MEARELELTKMLEQVTRMVYCFVDDEVIVDGVLQHHIEGIRKRLMETNELPRN